MASDCDFINYERISSVLGADRHDNIRYKHYYVKITIISLNYYSP